MSKFVFNPDLLIIHRKLAKLSQAHIGRMMGVDKMTISKWERGKYVPPARHIAKLARILKTKPQRLMLLDFEERSKVLNGR